MRALRLTLPVIALALAACGSSDSDSEATVATEPAEVVDAEPDEDLLTEAPTEDEPADAPVGTATLNTDPPQEQVEAEPVGSDAPVGTDAPVSTDAPVEAPRDAGGSAVTASLVQWAIEAPTEYTAGTITFSASNNGTFPHELVVISGDGYESLPLSDGGAVLEDELPEGAVIARTARLSGGDTEDLVVDLEPGNYVLVCNLGGGSNSHAGLGQNLDIVVS